MSKLKKVFVSLTVLLCASFICTSAGCFALKKPQYREEFEKTHGALPEDADLKYRLCKYYRDGRDEYHVWQFEFMPVGFLANKGFYDNEFATATEEEREQYISTFQERLYELIFPLDKTEFSKVPQEYQPDWNANFMFSGVLAGAKPLKFGASYFYDVDKKLLIVWCCHSRHYE